MLFKIGEARDRGMEGGNDEDYHSMSEGVIVEILTVVAYNTAGIEIRQFSEEEITLGFSVHLVKPDNPSACEVARWRLSIGQKYDVPVLVECGRVEFWDTDGFFGTCDTSIDATPLVS